MKERLDVLVVNNKLASSREKAKAMIMEGMVLVEGRLEDKPGSLFRNDVIITLKCSPMPYVSRGGLKLEKALKTFDIDLNGRVCMDVGSSTGGFTDCILQNNAALVYCVDVGYGQLDWTLRTDSRVVCMEKTNARYLRRDMIDKCPSFISVDVSFISVVKILEAVCLILEDSGEIVVLIKPQFEAGRDKVGKNGVVKDKRVHLDVVKSVIEASDKMKLEICGLDYSPIKGPKGNIEYLLYIKKSGNSSNVKEWENIAEKTVAGSHRELFGKI